MTGWNPVGSITGERGPQGVPGATGPTGAKGDSVTGPPGAAGLKGATGDTGPKGATGSQGSVGPQGPIGERGPQGIQGVPGGIGPQGVTGSQGPKGDTGNQGDPGTPGDLTSSDTAAFPVGSFGLGAWSLPTTKIRTLIGNSVITSMPTTPPANVAGTITMVIRQAATGGPYTLGWPASLKWAGDALPPTMPTVANAELIVHLFWTGTAWRGAVLGTYFP